MHHTLLPEARNVVENGKENASSPHSGGGAPAMARWPPQNAGVVRPHQKRTVENVIENGKENSPHSGGGSPAMAGRPPQNTGVISPHQKRVATGRFSVQGRRHREPSARWVDLNQIKSFIETSNYRIWNLRKYTQYTAYKETSLL